MPIAHADQGIAGNQEIPLTIKAIEVGAVGLSVETAFWLLRGNSLLASLLLSYPAWRNFDPLPVLTPKEHENEENEPTKSPIPKSSIPTGQTPFMIQDAYDSRS